MGTVGISQDVTNEKNEVAILKRIISMLPGHVWWTDKKSRVLGSNVQMARSYGYDKADNIVGKSTYDLLPEDLDEGVKKQLSEMHDRLDFSNHARCISIRRRRGVYYQWKSNEHSSPTNRRYAT